MINYIEVDGFKSLANFSLKLNTGLNVLVGPNGAGKTNIISFFEFLGSLQNTTIVSAVSNAGGAGVVFKKLGENSYQNNIKALIRGNIKLTNRKYLFYEYSFNIFMTHQIETIFYKSQRLRMKYRTVATNTTELPKNFKYDLDIEETIDTEATQKELKPTINLHKYSTNKLKDSFYLQILNDKKNKIPSKEIWQRILGYRSIERSFLPSINFFNEDTDLILNDLKGGQVFNIEPSKVKIAEDSAKAPGIRKDGSGLYATLYALKRNEIEKQQSRFPFFHWSKENRRIKNVKISEILSFVQLANNKIKEIDIVHEKFDNQLKVKISIESGKDSTILPLSSMSDGTTKWIALITLLLTCREIFSIEEPENYLHPLMQSEIVSIMRSVTKKDNFILVSTHSETFLNYLEPEEIIVTSFKNGKTLAKRPKYTNALKREIQETGFGLGYYYLAGNLEDE